MCGKRLGNRLPQAGTAANDQNLLPGKTGMHDLSLLKKDEKSFLLMCYTIKMENIRNNCFHYVENTLR
ncbi:hypothetical protein GCM10023078_16440 [Gibbsiella greigii]